MKRICDIPGTESGVVIKQYELWNSMFKRCYSESFHRRRPTYIGCSVDEPWWVFSNFKKWCDEHYTDGYFLDKDILFQGNKVYGPDTCCFVPVEINNLFTHKRANSTGFAGVHFDTNRKLFFVQISMAGRSTFLGRYEKLELAKAAYVNAKTEHVKKISQEFLSKGMITPDIHDAIMRYDFSK